MLKYSNNALAVRPRFFAPYNDITIVVEDETGEALYTQIMKRLLGDSLSIHNVLGMGGKSQVVQRFESRKSFDEAPTEFYIVDGDFDELIGHTCPSNRYFYRLNRYDIESFLVEEMSICIVAQEERPSKHLEQYKRELKVRPWQQEIVQVWWRLAACAALLQKMGDRKTKLDLSVERYRSGDDIVPDESKIKSAIKRVSQSQSIINQETFMHKLGEIADQMGASHSERQQWVSGKNVLIPLAMRLLRRHTRSNIRRDSLCFRLAKHCEFRELNELRERILSIIPVDVAKAGMHPSQAARG